MTVQEEDGLLLDVAYFQRETRATALFEFIGRQDVYLETDSMSLSHDCAGRKLCSIFPGKMKVSLNIVPYDKMFENTFMKGNGQESMDTLDEIIISDSDSPLKSVGTLKPLATSTPTTDVIVISDSPVKSPKNRIQYKNLTPSTSEEEQVEELLMKRLRKDILPECEEVGHTKKQRRFHRIVVPPSDSDDEIEVPEKTFQRNKFDTNGTNQSVQKNFPGLYDLRFQRKKILR